MTEVVLLFGLILAFRVIALCSAHDGQRIHWVLGELMFIGIFIALLGCLTHSVPAKGEWLSWLKQTAAGAESALAEGVFFSSSPHPGVVKETVGSGLVLESKQ